MKIFVTGGAGFVGKYLVISLLKKNHKVTIFDTSTQKMLKVKKITKNLTIVKGDIQKFSDLQKASFNSDLVVHLAAQISVNDSIKNPHITNAINVTGTLNILQACVANKISKIIVASTAAVYGVTKNISVNEKHTTNPISPYGVSKLAMEKYVQSFTHSNKLDAICLRFFNIYGDGQSTEYAGVISKFIERLNKNKPLEIFGAGTQTRDFVSIDDVVQAIEKSIKNLKGKRGNVYNIASGKSISIKELAKTLISISKKDVKITYRKARVGDLKYSRASIKLARKELNYSPKISLEKGLKQFFKNSL